MKRAKPRKQYQVYNLHQQLKRHKKIYIKNLVLKGQEDQWVLLDIKQDIDKYLFLYYIFKSKSNGF